MLEREMYHRTKCRICGSENLHKFLSLGETPLANGYLSKEDLNKEEQNYPLDVYFCEKCRLGQLLDVVSPKVLFKDYAYLSGASQPLKTHFGELAGDITSKYMVDKNNLVIDIGSNDGSLLHFFQQRGMQVLGVEPSENIAEIAQSKGIETIPHFFDECTALKIREGYGMADVITATNVFAHVDDLNDFLYGITHLLSGNGVFVIEVPYLPNLLNKMEFDTIYHEHLSYFSVYPLVYLFQKFGFQIADIKQIPIHGGSIRIFIQKRKRRLFASHNVMRLLSYERENKLDLVGTYMRFGKNVTTVKQKLVTLLKRLKNDGKKITGYGATAKGNTLLNYCGIGTDILDYVSDTTPFKQGHYTPGMHVPIVSEDRFHKEPPDYALLLAWNYADAILEKEKKYRENGGKFILPVPESEVVGND